MPIIRPVSDLRNNFAELSRIMHETGEPIFLTKNGHGDMVAMSIETYNSLFGRKGDEGNDGHQGET